LFDTRFNKDREDSLAPSVRLDIVQSASGLERTSKHGRCASMRTEEDRLQREMRNYTIVQARSGQSGDAVSRGGASLLEKLDSRVAERLEFLGAFLRMPARTGSLAPSSPSLARAMLYGCDLRRAKTVVELGPGTGAFTRFIVDRLPKQSRFIALELEDRHVRRLRERFPRVRVYRDSAERIQRYLPQSSRKADYIISGLPWANIHVQVQVRILDAILASLSPSGMFTTFAYWHARWLPRARQFRERLEQHFAEVKVSRVIWKNVPPAVVYRCRLKTQAPA
jgi:phospholipid N-methyltransferase